MMWDNEEFSAKECGKKRTRKTSIIEVVRIQNTRITRYENNNGERTGTVTDIEIDNGRYK